MTDHLHYDHVASDTRYQTALEQQEVALVSMLKPSIQIDGNQWCVLYGEDLQSGVAGFGDSPAAAVTAFNSNWYKKLGDE